MSKPLTNQKVFSQPEKTLFLIDISSFIFRAFYAIRTLHNRAGEPTNAVYGVATMLARLAEEAKPEYLAVVYDSKGPSFRKELYPEYKANRSQPPEDLVPQFSKIEALISSFEIHSYRQNGIEADDLIATLTERWCAASAENRVVIVSNDKDLMQLVNSQVTIWDTMSSKFYSSDEVIEKFSVRPDQVRDYLGMVGDSSDNIPGIPSIGPKSASDLLREYGTLEHVLRAAKEGKINGKKGETLRANEKIALLSAELATVKRDCEVEIPLDSLKYHFHLTQECIRLLEQLDFHSLVKRWSNFAVQERQDPGPSVIKKTDESTDQIASPEVATLGLDLKSPHKIVPDSKFVSVQTSEVFEALLSKMEEKKEFGFDLETTSLNPREAQIVGIAICVDPKEAFYIPIGHEGEEPQLPRGLVLEKLKPLLEDQKFKKIGQNLKYDWSVLIQHGFNPKGIYADTMVAAYLLNAGGRYNLQALAAQYLNYKVLTYEEVCGEGKNQITFDKVSIEVATRYSAEDAWLAVQLWEKLSPLIHQAGLEQIYREVDLPLIPILARMELNGVCIDVPWLNQLSEEFRVELEKIEQKVQSYSNGPINLNSPKQLGQLLFEHLKLPTQGKTKTGFSTDASVLEALSGLHEVPGLLLEYREISKLKGTYVDPLPNLRDPKTGKIHASFHQTVAATGRLSSSDPNLQNIPIRTDRGMKIRRAFIPEQGHLLLSTDYSQIELRLLAHMSADPELTEAFRKDEDVHQKTAADIFGIPLSKVDDRKRGIAKAINFGLMYGKTAFGLSQELKISRKEAQDIIQRYFEKYSAVKSFLDGLIEQARETGEVVTVLGRKRALPDIRSKNAAIRNNAERMAMNTPIQGTAADLMKLAMIDIDRKLKEGNYKSHLIIQVHDEVLLDCPKDEAEKVQQLVCHCMENAMKLSIPLKVNSALGKNWAEL